MIISIRLALLTLITALCSVMQGQDNYSLESKVYKPYIRSVQTLVDGSVTSVPLLILGRSQKMLIQFDDFLEEDKEYYYRLIHCTMDWKESDILDVVYLKGFHDEPLDNWQFSNGTVTNYTHYQLQLPNNDTDFQISGNYVLLIYELDDDSNVKPVITQRLLVAESKASVQSVIRFPTDVANIRFKQQMDIKVCPGSAKVNNPMRDIYLAVLQNGDFNKSIQPKTARNLRDGCLQYDPLGTYSFWGHTEFRNFDTRSLNSAGRGVQEVEQNPDGYKVRLAYDTRRDQEVYLLDFDFNGKYYVDNFESFRGYSQIQNNSQFSVLLDSIRSQFRYKDDQPFNSSTIVNKDVVADYADVEFTLQSQPVEGDVYVYGGLTNWEISDKYKMTYDNERNAYVSEIKLKQGYYDYCYVLKQGNKLDFTALEGSWADTENDYLMLVYSRVFGSRYDRLIGFKNSSSIENDN